MLRATGLHARYRGGPPVLAGVDLLVEPGVPVVLGGANGSGKSTLLRIVAGVVRPSAGTVERPPVVGYLPDRFPARLRLPADAYLRHMAAIRGVPAAPELLDALGFAGPRAAPMARLSKGNAQKVGLAQALGGDPGLLVLDEPWAGLDAAAAQVLAELLGRSAATLVVTDHTGRAARIPGARRLVLADGLVAPDTGTDPLPAVAVVLRCADPGPVLESLGVPGEAGPGGVLRLRLPAARSDAVLLAALRLGCSVESVGPA